VNFAAKKIGMEIGKDTTVVIHGFGKVGVPAAQDLRAQGAKIIAVSDVSGAVYNPEGLDIEACFQWTKERRFLKDIELPGTKLVSNEELLALDTDILIPAAIDGVVTAENCESVKAKIIAEGANGPLTKDAVTYLTERGAFIIPDILCNAGGVIVSYFEWVQGLQNFFWDLDQINGKLHDILKASFETVFECSQKYKVDMKKAALIAALKRLDRAMRLRGLFPS
jgi:glutamate dehydrogenase (NAD(P)+)